MRVIKWLRWLVRCRHNAVSKYPFFITVDYNPGVQYRYRHCLDCGAMLSRELVPNAHGEMTEVSHAESAG